MTDDNEIAVLREQVAGLGAKLSAMEARLRDMERLAELFSEEHKVDEETLMVISAAVAAVLGHKARVKQVHFHTSIGWTRAGRMEVQDHSKARPIVRQAPITLH